MSSPRFTISPPARYEWVLEGDIEACFDKFHHSAIVHRVRTSNRRPTYLGLVKAFLKGWILSEDGTNEGDHTGTPQGGILSPLLSNVALSVLDEHFAEARPGGMATQARLSTATRGWPRIASSDTRRLCRPCARDPSDTPKGLRDEAAAVLSPMGLRLTEEKTKDCPH